MDGNNPSTRTITSDRSPATAAVDNLLRRALKISNPYSADDVAKGLLALYPEDAAKMRRERMGVPFSVMAAQPIAAPARAGRPEVAAANDSLDRVLTELTTSPDLADIVPEMRGWATTIRRAAADGFSSAGFAIDASERDRAFAARRILGDYARLARYAAAINLCATEIYCRLAQACDLVANIILVLVGDSLADAGVTRSGAVIQVTAATLQARRDAIIVALRNLLQITPTGDQETWPRGTLAVQQIYDGLEQSGAPDLRALLDEAYLARQLDDLIDLATGSTPDGLRALGSTAAVTVQRLDRFLALTNDIVIPDSPPAKTLFAELQLFIQSFAGGNSGYRLPYLARSPLLVSGLTTTASIDQPTQRMLALALNRTALAEAIDCLCCCCDDDNTWDLVVAGKVLFDLDRAIDLYALGNDPNGVGDAEWRAAACGAVAFCAFRQNPRVMKNIDEFKVFHEPITKSLQWPVIITDPPPPEKTKRLRSSQFAGVINNMVEEEVRWSLLISSIAPYCQPKLLFQGIPGTGPGSIPNDPIGALLQRTTIEISNRVGNWGGFVVPRPTPSTVRVPAPIATSTNILARHDPYDPPDDPPLYEPKKTKP